MQAAGLGNPDRYSNHEAIVCKWKGELLVYKNPTSAEAIEAALKIAHPNVVRVIAASDFRERRFQNLQVSSYLSEFCSRNKLSFALTNAAHEFTLVRKWKILCDVASAIKFLHSQGEFGRFHGRSVFITQNWDAKIGLNLPLTGLGGSTTIRIGRLLPRHHYFFPETVKFVGDFACVSYLLHSEWTRIIKGSKASDDIFQFGCLMIFLLTGTSHCFSVLFSVIERLPWASAASAKQIIEKLKSKEPMPELLQLKDASVKQLLARLLHHAARFVSSLRIA